MTSLEFTRTEADQVSGVSIFKDPTHGHAPKDAVNLSRKEKFTSPEGYLIPVLERAPQVKPVSVGFFAGKLDYSTLDLLAMLFVRFIIRGADRFVRRVILNAGVQVLVINVPVVRNRGMSVPCRRRLSSTVKVSVDDGCR